MILYAWLLTLLAAPAAQEATPVGNVARWFTADDYPFEALWRGAQGRVGFRVTVTPQGSVGGCVIAQTSGDPALDRVTCEILRSRGRFHPVPGGDGGAVQASYSGRVTWQPGLSASNDLRPEVAPMRLLATMRQGAGGTPICISNMSPLPRQTRVFLACFLLDAAGAPEVVRVAPAGTVFAVAVTLSPSSQAEQPPVASVPPIYRMAARLTIRPDGSVSACTPSRQDARPDIGGFREPPRLCALYPPGAQPLFRPDPTRTGTRDAQIEMAFYLGPVARN